MLFLCKLGVFMNLMLAWKLKINNIDIEFNYKLYDKLSSILHMVKSKKK